MEEFGAVGDATKEVGTGIQLQCKLSDSRLLTFNSAIARDASLAEHNQLVEKLSSVCDRQEMKFLLESLESNLVVDRDGLVAAQEAFMAVDVRSETEWRRRGKQGKHKLSDSENAAKMQCGVNIGRFKEEIKKKELAIAELKEKIAKDV